MSKLIRIDDDIYEAIQLKAIPFEDTPNTMLRKILLKYGVLKSQGIKEVPVIRRTQLTSEKSLRIPVAEALSELGGRARAIDVTELVISKLKPGADDMQKLDSGPRRIEKQIHWARNTLRIKDVISRSSPRGIWELTEYGHDWLNEEKI